MMFVIFLIIALAIALLWAHCKRASIVLFSSYFLLLIIWFSHHATDKLNIVL